MENELMQVDVQGIEMVQGSVIFNDYERVKKEAEALAEQIKTVEVNEENIKHSKKLLAVVNKRLKDLEDARIGIKKAMLEPYQLFETQVKEIVGIVKEADAEVRSQVKYLEEFERLEKEEAIRLIWEKRKNHFTLGKTLIPFTDFLKPKFMNKTMNIEAVENEMVAFLKRTEIDFQAINSMSNSNSVLKAYLGQYDLGEAISQVNKEEARARQIEASKAITKQKVREKHFFEVYTEKDKRLVELLLEQNEIEFKFIKDGF
jgi:hypothetical protein